MKAITFVAKRKLKPLHWQQVIRYWWYIILGRSVEQQEHTHIEMANTKIIDNALYYRYDVYYYDTVYYYYILLLLYYYYYANYSFLLLLLLLLRWFVKRGWRAFFYHLKCNVSKPKVNINLRRRLLATLVGASTSYLLWTYFSFFCKHFSVAGPFCS